MEQTARVRLELEHIERIAKAHGFDNGEYVNRVLLMLPMLLMAANIRPTNETARALRVVADCIDAGIGNPNQPTSVN